MSMHSLEHIEQGNGKTPAGVSGSRLRRSALPRGKKALASPGRSKKKQKVSVWIEDLIIPTYLPAAPDKNPMFLEKRVYQGSSGKVYPLPFTDHIAEKPVERRWKAVWIENEFLRAMVLPELGGRIHIMQDKTNGYELIYRQPIIKPALVGLAGPWISGGIEFNWPQHHRPGTFLPVNFEVEERSDGSKTIWCSDHDPMARMKGMHGVCLHPNKACLELKVRAYNRTPFVQTFLWWANVATRVHEAYQSFFPPDVYYVADHARRSTSAYPVCEGFYYGVNYAERGRKGIPKSEIPAQFVPPSCRGKSEIRNPKSEIPDYPPNDLSFYANIPTPCSYMCMASKENFFGGYDYAADAGIVHWANHHISPGKKQWTWGNHEFGYAWDRHLTDADPNGEYGPYIEIMAGVYTDNQPDFSFLQPGETKVWSQYWYPIQKIGPPRYANLKAALNLLLEKRKFFVGIAVTESFPRAVVRLERADGSAAAEWDANLAPGRPFVLESPQARKPWKTGETRLRVLDQHGTEIISWLPRPRVVGKVPSPATEPPLPAEITSADELYVTGLHLEQYRHATRCPTLYWREALRRDPLDARCNNALGLWHLRRGEFSAAEGYFRKAIARLTRRNPNPYEGEAYYNLGLCLRYLGRDEEAYGELYKATWNQAWAAAGFHAVAELDCQLANWDAALEHLAQSLRFNTDNTRARNLKAIVLAKLGRRTDARLLLADTLTLDPLDWWARHLQAETLTCDLQTILDVALDYIRAGLYPQAVTLLRSALKAASAASHIAARANGGHKHELPDQNWGAAPLVHYYLGWLYEKLGNEEAALAQYRTASLLPPDYCFPARIEEIAILEAAMRANPGDARAPYYLGNLLYDKRRHEEAISLWEKAAKRDPKFSIVWRNLGIGYFNIERKPARSCAAYERALQANPGDSRLLYERDQLWKRLQQPPKKRLRELERNLEQVQQRDDLSVELYALYNQVGRHQDALALVSSRRFQPWEGGEGAALGQHVRSHLALGRESLAQGDPGQARQHFAAALNPPANLGEARHLLANQSDIQYWLGCADQALGDSAAARRHWLAAATFKGDFQDMSVRPFSEMTYYSARAWEKLGQRRKARELFNQLLAYGRRLQSSPARIDYFATSLPTMLLFDDDLSFRQETTTLFLQAQAQLGLGRMPRAKSLLRLVLRRDPSHALAADLLKDVSL